MKLILDQFIHKTNPIDKVLISLISLFPLLLVISIFLADLFASFSALILISLFFQNKNKKIFSEVKIEIFYFLLFYFIVLISLIFSTSIKESFLPSFFYFRYFLFALSIYYLFKKYLFFKNIIFSSLIISFSIIAIDATIQYITGSNILGYPLMADPTPILTSFLNDEKKLGSFFVRLLPFLLSLLYILNLKRFSKYALLVIGFFIFLSSERVALFLFFIILFFYFLIIKNQIKFLIITFSIFLIFLTLNKELKYKYFDYTFQQLGFVETEWNKDHIDKKRYFSKEHEDLLLTAFIIFKDNILKGTGIKTFYQNCNSYKLKEEENKISYLDFLDRNNKITCSTHPHNLYMQILSEIGIFGFILIFFLFLKILFENIKIIFKRNNTNITLSYYLVNIGILINIFPFIPYGNFFNNWLSLIIFYPLGFWFFINKENKKIINK